MKTTMLLPLALLCLCCLLAGCATQRALRDANGAYAQGRLEDGLQVLNGALVDNPTDPQLRSALLTMRERGIRQLLGAAEDARRGGDAATATAAYRRVLVIDRDNVRARNGLQELERDARHKALLSEIRDSEGKRDDAASIEKLRGILAESADDDDARALLRQLERKTRAPRNDTRIERALQKTLSIDFKDAMLKQVFEVLARTTSVNFVFDREVRGDQKVTLFLNGTSVREALDVLLFTNQLERRVLDDNTVLIYPNTPAKLKDYQQLTVRGFFLANADPEPVANALKSLLKMKDVIVDKRQNLITVRDTPEGVRLAEKLIALHDLPEPEVMLDVEILEINRNRLTELGIKYPNQLILAPLTAVTGDTLTLDDLAGLNANTLGAQISPLVVNARRETADIQLLANPRIRVRNRDTAKILIGDKVPNITTTSTATGFVSSNVQYLDVGLKLEVMPTITVDNEVAIKISLEVSNIANQITTADRTIAYQIGTRSASTVLRLKDGENQVLAGLINDDDRRSASKVPGLGDLPIVGRLFSSHLDEGKKTEIVLSITPRLVRNTVRPSLSVAEFDSGTENSLRGLGRASAGAPAPAGTEKTAAPAAAPRSLALPDAPAPSPSPASSKVIEGAAIRWEAPAQVKAGDTFTLKIDMATGQPWSGVPLVLGVEPGKFDVVSVQPGTLLNRDGGDANFSQRVDRASGQVFITATRDSKDDNAPGGTGDSSLAVVTLKAVGAPGPAAVRLVTAATLGIDGASLPVSVPSPLTVTITP